MIYLKKNALSALLILLNFHDIIAKLFKKEYIKVLESLVLMIQYFRKIVVFGTRFIKHYFINALNLRLNKVSLLQDAR